VFPRRTDFAQAKTERRSNVTLSSEPTFAVSGTKVSNGPETNERLSFDRSFKHGTGYRISLACLDKFHNRQSNGTDWTCHAFVPPLVLV
jgi:hypothetical protein